MATLAKIAGVNVSSLAKVVGVNKASLSKFMGLDTADAAGFDVKAYTGTGASNSLTGLGFQPDLVWIKSRSAATDHALYDSVRGVEKRLESNTTDAEVTTDAGLTAFGSDGFTVNTLAQVNTDTATYAAWCWKKGATPGFDIVGFTMAGSGNTTVNHSLGVTPEFCIVKRRNSANWAIWHNSLTAYNYYLWFTTAAQSNSLDFFASAPTSSTITCGSVLADGTTAVAYLWASVPGFSKFGSYTGNGSATGPSVTAPGFTPKAVLIKRTDSSGNWVMIDSVRGDSILLANSSGVESSSDYLDFTASGFNIKTTNADVNANDGTYIYGCWAA